MENVLLIDSWSSGLSTFREIHGGSSSSITSVSYGLTDFPLKISIDVLDAAITWRSLHQRFHRQPMHRFQVQVPTSCVISRKRKRNTCLQQPSSPIPAVGQSIPPQQPNNLALLLTRLTKFQANNHSILTSNANGSDDKSSDKWNAFPNSLSCSLFHFEWSGIVRYWSNLNSFSRFSTENISMNIFRLFHSFIQA